MTDETRHLIGMLLGTEEDWPTAFETLLGRLGPTIRTLLSRPAGEAVGPYWQFLPVSDLGTTAWTAALTMAGYLLRAQFTRIDDVLGPVSTTIVVVLVGWYLWRVATSGRRRRHAD